MSKTPFSNLPLNTKQTYAMATFPGGTELYFPVDSRKEEVVIKARDEMQLYLNHYYQIPKVLA